MSERSAPPWTACAVCGLVLNASEAPTGGHEFFHPGAVDHVTVPVPVEDIRAQLLCDLCSAPNARWVVPVEDFDIDAANRSAGDWAACDECAQDIATSRWSRVVSRTRAGAKGRGEPPIPRRVYEAMFAQVRAHMTGPVRLRTGDPPQG